MRQLKPMALCLISLLFLFFRTSAALADVAPGEVIDKSNWEKAQGLMPENVLNWLKRGDFTMEVAELNFDPKDFGPPAALTDANKGKYDVSEEGIIVEVATGKAAGFIEGNPFPEIDPNDPKAGIKLMFRKMYQSYTLGHLDYRFAASWIGRKTGYEREFTASYRLYVLDGAPAVREEKNPENFERFVMNLVLSPFDIKGTNILNWRYRDHRQDSSWSYLPAIRRVRRMSPANRSDAFVGSDICIDDAWGFDGKPNSMNWKVLGKQEALVPFLSADPQPFVITETGAWMTPPTAEQPLYGFQVDGWQGAPWWPANIVWAKRQVYVVEISPKDPYYNYGVMHFWMDTDAQLVSVWKVINDRAGDYWKTFWTGWGAFQGPEEHQKAMVIAIELGIDDRRNHATTITTGSEEYPAIYNEAWDRRDFSLAGFTRFCK